MKDLLEMFIYKPKKTEKLIIASIKFLFSLCFSIWIFETIGLTDIIQHLTEREKLKLFIFKGYIILFALCFYLLYQVFFNISSYIFAFVASVSYYLFRVALYITGKIFDFLLALIKWPFIKKFNFTFKPNVNIYDDGFFSFIFKIAKKILVKAELMKSTEQSIISSKKLYNITTLFKEALANKHIIFNRIHVIFMFSVLHLFFILTI